MAKSPLLAALAQLDPQNGNHWTEDGAPRLDTVKMLASDNTITREAVTLAAPGFSRTVPLQGAAPAGGGVGAGAVANGAPASSQAPSQGDGNVAQVQGSTPIGTAVADADEGAADPLSVAERAYKQALARQVQANADVAATCKACDLLIEARDKARGAKGPDSPVAAYLKTQKGILEERGRRMEALKGIDIRSILPQRAPVDLALARKTARGGQRPRMG